jgi:epoxide hydrolase-like predicted phosphatase
MPIQAVIWDLGGVLLRTTDYTPREELAANLGIPRLEMEKTFFSGTSGARAQLGEIDVPQHLNNIRREFHLSEDEMAAFWDKFWRGDELDTELIDFIRQLKGSYKTGLLSNAFSDLREWITTHGRFADAFYNMVISAEEGVMKPDPRIYKRSLENLGVAAGDAIFIDDFEHNVEGARAVGMHAIHFRNPDQARADVNLLLSGDN